jgi:hypothetical protein
VCRRGCVYQFCSMFDRGSDIASKTFPGESLGERTAHASSRTIPSLPRSASVPYTASLVRSRCVESTTRPYTAIWLAANCCGCGPRFNATKSRCPAPVVHTPVLLRTPQGGCTRLPPMPGVHDAGGVSDDITSASSRGPGVPPPH